MKHNSIIKVLAIALISAAGFYFIWHNHVSIENRARPTARPQTQATSSGQAEASTSTNTLPSKGSSATSLLSNINSGFIAHTRDVIDADKGLSPALKNIKREAISIITHNSSDPAQTAWYDEHLHLRAAGHRYVLMTLAKESGSYDIVVNFTTRQYKQIMDAGTPSYATEDMVLYVTDNKISCYKIDMPTAIVLPGSVLSTRGETYHAGDQDIALDPKVTLTNATLTVSVFDSRTFHENPDDPAGPGGFAKLRDVTFTLP